MSKETAFYPRLKTLTDEWMDLFGYWAPLTVTDTLEEYRAVRETAGLMDFTMLRKVDLDGPGALELVDGIVGRDVSKLPRGHIAYGPLVDEDGKMVDDCTVMNRGPDRVRFCGANDRARPLPDRGRFHHRRRRVRPVGLAVRVRARLGGLVRQGEPARARRARARPRRDGAAADERRARIRRRRRERRAALGRRLRHAGRRLALPRRQDPRAGEGARGAGKGRRDAAVRDRERRGGRG